MKFKNPLNGHVEEVIKNEWVWVFLFGVFYFAAKKVWSHVLIGSVCVILTEGISWVIYPFFTKIIMRNHYLREGWIEIYE